MTDVTPGSAPARDLARVGESSSKVGPMAEPGRGDVKGAIAPFDLLLTVDPPWGKGGEGLWDICTASLCPIHLGVWETPGTPTRRELVRPISVLHVEKIPPFSLTFTLKGPLFLR